MNKNTTGNKVRNLLRAARAGFKSAAHFNLAFGKFQKLMNHLSIPLRDSANNEFRRVALANWKGARAIAQVAHQSSRGHAIAAAIARATGEKGGK